MSNSTAEIYFGRERATKNVHLKNTEYYLKCKRNFITNLKKYQKKSNSTCGRQSLIQFIKIVFNECQRSGS